MIRLILVGVLLLLSLAFFLQNQEQEVTLRYFFGLLESSTPIYKPILAGFAVGLLVSGILLFPLGAGPDRTSPKDQSPAGCRSGLGAIAPLARKSHGPDFPYRHRRIPSGPPR